MHRRNVAPSRSRLIGFSSIAVKPPSVQRLRTSGPCSPVSAMIGIVATRPRSSRILRVVSNPSRPGIWMSIRIASKLSRLARRTASSPLLAQNTAKPRRVSAASNSDWFTLSSSTTNMRPPRAADADRVQHLERRPLRQQLLGHGHHLIGIRRRRHDRIHLRRSRRHHRSRSRSRGGRTACRADGSRTPPRACRRDCLAARQGRARHAALPSARPRPGRDSRPARSRPAAPTSPSWLPMVRALLSSSATINAVRPANSGPLVACDTRSAGNSKVNSLPTPTALSTVSEPPISTAFSRHSARPSPRPRGRRCPGRDRA